MNTCLFCGKPTNMVVKDGDGVRYSCCNECKISRRGLSISVIMKDKVDR
jgi:hypothetical protein